MIERKHVEAISGHWDRIFNDPDAALRGISDTQIVACCALSAAISAALSAADESPCVWTEDGGCILKTACGRYWQTLEDGDRIDFPHCPYCGRKITEPLTWALNCVTCGIEETKTGTIPDRRKPTASDRAVERIKEWCAAGHTPGKPPELNAAEAYVCSAIMGIIREEAERER